MPGDHLKGTSDVMRKQPKKPYDKTGFELTNVKVLAPLTTGQVIAEEKSPFRVRDLRRSVRRVPVNAKQKK
jgi:hypothetical protein